VSGDPAPPRPFVRPVAERPGVAGPAGALETVAETPAGFDGRRAALVCHPHPLFGGTMDNKVVTITARALQEAGYATVRFNFRGVGASAGAFDDGRGETEDALAVADWAERRWPGARLTAAGFSFGAYVAYRLAGLRAVERLITIAPPVKRFNFAEHPVPPVPWIVIQGDRDEVVDVKAVLEWTRTAAPAPQVRVVAGAEHFFHGRLNDLREAVLASLAP
jgi:alpha/beta superfamily hydrolase